MSNLLNMKREDIWRLVILSLAVVVEGFAIISIVLNQEFFSLGTLYPNVISVALFLMPSVVGFLSVRLSAAVVLAMLPFWVTSIIYLAEFGSIWNIDLFQLGVLASRVAGMAFLLAVLGTFGWFLRRMLLGENATRYFGWRSRA